MTLFIGIDLGTSGCRAMAVDEHGEIRGQTAVSLPAPERDGDRCEQEPRVWWDAVCRCLDELTQQIPADEVAALAVDGTSATLLLTDEHGEPLGPALMYNDSRAKAQAERIKSIAPANTAAHGATGALAKLLWLQDAGLTRSARHALHQADWIAGKLCGRFGVSDFNNALKLGFDPVNNCWPEWLARLKAPMDLLPEVVVPGTTLGTLSAALITESARRFTLPENTRVVAGTTDSTAAFLATGARDIGEAVTVLGSTLVLKVVADTPVFAPEFGVYSQPLPSGRWLVGGASNSGGVVLRQYFSDAQLAAMTPRLRPEHPTGLDYYPLPAIGERFPVNDPGKQPRLAPRPEDDAQFFQGILEGIARIEAEGYALLARLGAPYPISVRSTGGGAQNAAWTAIRAHFLGSIMKPAHSTDAAYGAALLAKSGVTS
jgi:hypothetical protein